MTTLPLFSGLTCVEFHECGGEVLLGDRVGHEADEEGRGPVLHRRVYHIEDLYDLQSEKINNPD